MKIVLQDSGDMGITKAILGSNFPIEAIMKIVKLINMCLNQNQLRVLPLTMSDVIHEINGALQLEEGQKVEEGVIKIEISQYASQ